MLKESGIDTYINIVVKEGEISITPAPVPAKDDIINTKMSEQALSVDWLNSDEDEAWKSL